MEIIKLLLYFSSIINTRPIELNQDEVTTLVKPTSLEGLTQTTQLLEESARPVFQPTVPTTIRNGFTL